MSPSHPASSGTAFSRREASLAWPVESEVGPGLSGAVACGTRVARLDPGGGTLELRGVPIEELAERPDFERVAFLLIEGRRAEEDPEGWAGCRARLRAGRNLPREVIELIYGLDPGIHPTRLLRAGVSALGCHVMRGTGEQDPARRWEEMTLIGQVCGLVAVVARRRRGLPPLEPDPDSSLAEGLLRVLLDRTPEAEEVRALDLGWILYADHGLDAPTFTSMIVASTLADPYYNIVAGLSALRGPRQGGAGEEVLRQVLALRDGRVARAWVRGMLAQGWRIPGFGHRLYRRPEPRVEIFREWAARLARARGRELLYDVVRAVEEEAGPPLAKKGVYVNINLYAAPLFHLLGAETALVPCLVAVGRMAGLAARVREYLAHNRLFRPLARYVGPGERHFPRKGGR